MNAARYDAPGAAAARQGPARVNAPVLATVLRFPYSAGTPPTAYGEAAIGTRREGSRALPALILSAMLHVAGLAAIDATIREHGLAPPSAGRAPLVMQVELAPPAAPPKANRVERAPPRPRAVAQQMSVSARRVPPTPPAVTPRDRAPAPVAVPPAAADKAVRVQPSDPKAAERGAPIPAPVSATSGTDIPTAGSTPATQASTAGSTPATQASTTGSTPAPQLSAAASTPVTYVHSPKPEYPLAAREDEEEGVVVLRVRVSGAGLPLEVRVDRSSGFALLDRAAASAVRRWTFAAATSGGRHIESWLVIPIRFRLSDP